MSVTMIGSRAIGQDQMPMIVAEMSGNHNQSLERALEIVDAAADAGAHAIKMQTYTPDTITLNVPEGDFVISDPGSPWVGRTLHDLYSEACTPWDWHEAIFSRARDRGLVAFSTPFDESAVDFLEQLESPCYKIASFEVTHLPLIRKVASTGKPIVISTGMATLAEISEAVDVARDSGCEQLVLLKCTSAYPASPESSDLLTIPNMRAVFGCSVGVSDHSLGLGVSLAATALGAVMIEKHLTLSRSDGGVDAIFSMEPDELSALVVESERAWQSLGGVSYGPREAEEPSMQSRRSLYVAEDMTEGETFTESNLRIVRPDFGLSPKYYDIILGKRVNRPVRKGTPVGWELIG